MTQKNSAASQVALVTGSAKRIGAAIVQKLHENGFDVIIHYHHSKKEAFQLAQELNDQRKNSAIALNANLRESSHIAQLIEAALQWKQRLDVLVNNASIFMRTPIQQANESAFELMWQTNVSAPLWLSEAAFPSLSQYQGCIINLTDIHAEKPLKDYGLYCQTKAALKMQTEMLAKEYAPRVRVNAVAPGAVAWPEGSNVLTQVQKNKIIKKTPLNCHGDPLWIAESVLFLIKNGFITGQTIRVDGGRSL